MKERGSGSALSFSTVLAAGFASATAATVTSSFGVAGTLVGAALTTMIITGGSVILKTYLETVSGHVRRVPEKVRARANRQRAGRSSAGAATIPGRPNLRDNFVGRLRAAFDWFARLSISRRRSILVGSVVPAVIAFIVAMGAVTSAELAIGKSLSCGLWGKCPVSVADTGGEVSSADTTLSRLTRGSSSGSGVSPSVRQSVPGARQNVRPDPSAPVSGSQNQDAPSDTAVPEEEVPLEQPAGEEPAPADSSGTGEQQPSSAPVEPVE